MFFLHLVLALIIVAVVGWLINTFVPLPRNVKPILNVVLALIVVGMVLDLINTYIPMAGSIRVILNVVVVVATCVRVFEAVGFVESGTPDVGHPHDAASNLRVTSRAPRNGLRLFA